MNKILEMIKNEKVEWKKLWEVTSWDKKFNGVEKSKQQKVDKYHYYLASELKALSSNDGNIKILTTNITDMYANEDDVSNNISSGEIVCIPWGGNPVVQYFNGKFITGDNRIARSIDTNILLNKYLYYFLLENIYLIEKLYRGSGIKHPNMKRVLELEIPIPSLEIQEKIVKILDTMVDHFTQLQAELQARNRQYEYYRDKLLSEEYLNKLTKKSGGNTQQKTLGDIGKISMCKRILKNQTSNTGEIPFYKIGTFGNTPDSFISKELFSEYKDKFSYPREGNILFSASGTIGRTVIFDGKDSYYQDSNIVWIDNDESQALDKYLYYFYQIVKWPVSKGGTISRIYNREINKIKIPVPPIAVQEHIVSILDNFNKIVTDINEGLPKEIELRQKQYEYYRERLLEFKREED